MKIAAAALMLVLTACRGGSESSRSLTGAEMMPMPDDVRSEYLRFEELRPAPR